MQGLQQEVLNWLIERQETLVEKYGVKDKRIRAFIVLDDVVSFADRASGGQSYPRTTHPLPFR